MRVKAGRIIVAGTGVDVSHLFRFDPKSGLIVLLDGGTLEPLLDGTRMIEFVWPDPADPAKPWMRTAVHIPGKLLPGHYLQIGLDKMAADAIREDAKQKPGPTDSEQALADAHAIELLIPVLDEARQAFLGIFGKDHGFPTKQHLYGIVQRLRGRADPPKPPEGGGKL